MISALTTYPVAKGSEPAFEAAFAELQQQVIRGEPGTVGFQLFCAAGDARLYKVIAHFRDELAMDAHIAGPYLNAMSRRLFPLCEQPPQVEVLRAI